ncbi:MAG: citrate transporter [Ignavibacteriales bacterium]|nr:citrate transporter [Ignavibacteriales bacterium]
MENIQVILLIGIFLLMTILMFLRKIPALIALPVMAFLISIIGGVSLEDTIKFVLGQGSLKLHSAYTIAMFGSMLSVILQKTGVAESFIKKGAELSGDSPWTIAVIMLILIALLFTTIGGLGAVIMVATIVLPIMASVGIGPMTSVGIFLIGISMGGALNVGSWAVYIDVLGLTVEKIRPFALIMFSITFIASLVYITVQLFRDGQNLKLKKIIKNSTIFIGSIVTILVLYNYILSVNMKLVVDKVISNVGIVIGWIILGGVVLLFIIAIIRIILKKNETETEVHWITYFSPIIPLLLILIFSMDFIAAFIVGLIYVFIATYKKGRLNLFVKSIFEGGGVVMPAVVLMFGIGMLLVAVMGPGVELEAYPNGWPVLNLLRPVVLAIVPNSPLFYVIIFTIAAPLALYRGPLNVWGMGYGIAAVFLASGMNPGAIMGLLLAVGQIQGISDPTNTHNVWLANEMRVDVQKVLWNTISYSWALALIGLIISALLFM